MPLLPGMSPLTAAANALKSAGAGASLVKQINTVSNALVGSRRKRLLATKQKVVGLPPEARSVLDILKVQVKNCLKLISGAEASEAAYQKFVDDLEIIQGFVERVIQHYRPAKEGWSEEDEEFASFIMETLSKAKSEAITSLSLQKFQEKLHHLQVKYESSPKMSKKEFTKALTDVAEGIRNWEDQLIPKDPFVRESKAIRRRLTKLKAKLKEVFEIVELTDHPGNLGEEALNILRVSASMMQEAGSRFEVEQSVEMAVSAITNLSKSSIDFQERGRSYFLLIQQSVALFVHKQLKKMEVELAAPVYFEPGNIKENDNIAEKFKNQMERLVTYDQFAKIWSGPHQEDLMERIALLYEQVSKRAEKAREFILDNAFHKETPFELIQDLACIAGKHFETGTLGSDHIHPAEVFHEPTDLSHQVDQLLNNLPDPMMHGEYDVSFERLGRYYYQATALRDLEEMTPGLHQKLTIVINRIEHHVLRKDYQGDIFHEWILREKYDEEVFHSEVNRLLTRMGLQPEMRTPEKYVEYADPSEYPFKGNQLAEVMKSYRIFSHLFTGRFGAIEEYPLLREIAQDTYEERVSHAAKVKLELIKRLTLSFLHPPSLDELENIVESRIRTLPDELQTRVKDSHHRLSDILKDEKKYEDQWAHVNDVQELWLMFEYIKTTYVLKKSYSEKLLEECRAHFEVTQKILFPLAKSRPELIQSLHLKSLPDIFSESESVSFQLPQSFIAEMNEENQFAKDHKIPEMLPLYVTGTSTVNEEIADPTQRLAALIENETTLCEWIESTATQNLFKAPLEKFEGIHEIFIGPNGFSTIELAIEERCIFTEIVLEKKEVIITGFAQLLLMQPSSEEPEEVGNVTMKVQTNFCNGVCQCASVTFVNQPYHICISIHREGKKWDLF